MEKGGDQEVGGGPRTNRCRRRFRTLHKRARKAAAELNLKYERKIDHLKTKFDTEKRKIPTRKREIRPKGRYEDQYPGLLIYKSREENEGVEKALDNLSAMEEVMVLGDIELSDNERRVGRFPPNMAINPRLFREGFQNDLMQGMSGARWGRQKVNEFDETS